MKKIQCGCNIFPSLHGGDFKKNITYALYPKHFSPLEKELFLKSEEAYQRAGFSVKRIPFSQKEIIPSVIVYLSTHQDIIKLYPQLKDSPGFSLTDRSTFPMSIHLHLENWLHIPKHLGSDFTDLNKYREALISHEFSHVLGYEHVNCACQGCPRDVRQQPSRSSGGCNINHTEIVLNPKSPYTSVNF